MRPLGYATIIRTGSAYAELCTTLFFRQRLDAQVSARAQPVQQILELLNETSECVDTSNLLMLMVLFEPGTGLEEKHERQR